MKIFEYFAVATQRDKYCNMYQIMFEACNKALTELEKPQVNIQQVADILHLGQINAAEELTKEE